MTNKVFGMAWYREEDYRRILKIMEDAAMLPRTYKRWKHLVERGERRQKAAGRIVIRAIIEPEKFLTWTEGQGLNAGLHARARYASLVATQISEGT
ncbi:hypothetical protein [Acidocella sp.]|uniref:hypothetical protein n=1 Tax=Acidocella sp. TaxID=50710 RepID=UPI002F40722D